MKCKNCEKQLSENDKFCNECGAKVIEQRLTNGFFISEVKENFFSIDANRPLRTFVDLFKEPEAVVCGYINGVRKKYINPFGYFTIAITLTTFFYFVAQKFFPESIEAGMSMATSINEEQKASVNKFQSAIFEYQSLLYFAFIPFFAIITWLLFIVKRRYNFVEHLILNMYGYSQASIFVIIGYFITVSFESVFQYAMITSMLLQVIYYAYFLKRIFKLSFGQIVLKTLLFIPLGFVFYMIISVIVIVILLLIGVIELKDFLPPPKETKDAVSYIASSVINWTS
ncbi:hypothetical protein ULMS_12040 [Patiriisocius marinistellae]|uniref:Zinc-ribbon domain-containing protein n=1 Tax=Patiriisocius marinistellae TaxID=2494560 RepID=A0A5J4FZR4_9FLAO|nr:DUF3667 domain-containing protein [Patiriisocius marinistellae]GEQ85696.1 hypothetical protein ULMS_12040 [Patiriisocius marinistellae]